MAKAAAGGVADLKVAVGRTVRLRRLELGMDQKELAERLGTTQARVSKIEGGVHDLKLTTLGRLERALGIRLLASAEGPSGASAGDPGGTPSGGTLATKG